MTPAWPRKAPSAFNCLAAEAMLTICHCVTVELCVALPSADRSSMVMHYRGVSMHGGKRVPVSLFPTTEPRARRGDDHGVIIHFHSRSITLRRRRGSTNDRTPLREGIVDGDRAQRTRRQVSSSNGHFDGRLWHTGVSRIKRITRHTRRYSDQSPPNLDAVVVCRLPRSSVLSSRKPAKPGAAKIAVTMVSG
jgi:hypothetical protein